MPKPGSIDPTHFEPPGRVGRVARTERGVSIETGDELFRVDVLGPDLFRLKLSAGGAFDETPTFAPAFDDLPACAPFELRETADTLTISTERMRFVAEKRDLTFDVYRDDGSTVIEAVRDEEGNGRGLVRLNDSFIVQRKAERDDAFYGLGQKTGPFDRRGGRFILWNVDVLSPGVRERNRLYDADLSETGRSTRFDPYYTSIPFFYHARPRGGSLAVAGFFIDNPYPSNFDFSHEDRFSFSFSGGQYTEYVFAGPRMRSILEAYTRVTGRMAVPPLWALGHHQCRWHDYTDRDLLEIANEYRSRGIPCDALWLDIGHMDGYRVFTWDKERFPDPEGFLQSLDRSGFRCVTIVDPGLKREPGYAVFDRAKERNLLCKTEGGRVYVGQVWPGHTAFPDFVKPEARTFWAEWTARHAARGVAGIWNDMNEPATGEIAPFAMRFDRDGRNFPHERYHNQYALLMAMATRDGLLAAQPDRRPFVLSRAGSAGIQRFAAQWLGDNHSEWEHLAMAIPMALGMGVSGQPFVGADVPGFAGAAGPELAARWFEYGALTPFCRCHNAIGQPDKYPWSFGPEVERVAREALELRYRLLPYLYSAFVRAAESGEPVQRPLVFDFPDDPSARAIDDQYLLGDALLVAPVVRAGQGERDVYLPRGTWIDWRTGQAREGGGRIAARAAFEGAPLYARGGAVVPLLETAPASTLASYPELIELRVFVPREDGQWTSLLVEDDGLSFAFRVGAEVRTRFVVVRNGSELRLRARAEGRGFAEFRRRRLRCVFYGPGPRSIFLDGKAVEPEPRALSADGAGPAGGSPAVGAATAGFTAIVIENSGEPFEVFLTL